MHQYIIFPQIAHYTRKREICQDFSLSLFRLYTTRIKYPIDFVFFVMNFPCSICKIYNIPPIHLVYGNPSLSCAYSPTIQKSGDMAYFSLSPLCYYSIQILVDKINQFPQNWRALIPRPSSCTQYRRNNSGRYGNMGIRRNF